MPKRKTRTGKATQAAGRRTPLVPTQDRSRERFDRILTAALDGAKTIADCPGTLAVCLCNRLETVGRLVDVRRQHLHPVRDAVFEQDLDLVGIVHGDRKSVV